MDIVLIFAYSIIHFYDEEELVYICAEVFYKAYSVQNVRCAPHPWFYTGPPSTPCGGTLFLNSPVAAWLFAV